MFGATLVFLFVLFVPDEISLDKYIKVQQWSEQYPELKENLAEFMKNSKIDESEYTKLEKAVNIKKWSEESPEINEKQAAFMEDGRINGMEYSKLKRLKESLVILLIKKRAGL